ncbi:MAG: flagellar hook-length control protein FliK [Caulobacterales bacterium]|nr:flagellar hook-length control protein FliK [Caulobacterales bacterium]
MSPSEILSRAAPTAPTPPTPERADAGQFDGLLRDQTVSPTRGRLGVGRWLRSEPETTMRLDGTDPAVLPGMAGSWFERPLINPGPNAEGKLTGPLINPGPNAETKLTGPLINPGPHISGKEAGPLINPGIEGQTGSDVSPVPGAMSGVSGPLSAAEVTEASGGVARPSTGALQAALNALSTNGQSQAVTSLAQAAQQAVARVPEAGALEGAATVEVPTPELDLAPVPTTPATGSTTAEPGSGGSAAPTPNGAAVGQAVAQDQAASSPASEAVELAQTDDVATDLQRAETEVPANQTGTTGPAQASLTRADAASLAGRLSFDTLAQVSAQIIRRLEHRTTRFDMELNPVELGRVDVRLDIDSEGRLAARLAFDNPAAALELRGRVDDLRRELQQAGFQLADDAFSFTDRGDSERGGAFDRDDARLAHARSAAAAEQADVAAQPVLRTLTRLGLDVRV